MGASDSGPERESGYLRTCARPPGEFAAPRKRNSELTGEIS
jgi:hypothetical protein